MRPLATSEQISPGSRVLAPANARAADLYPPALPLLLVALGLLARFQLARSLFLNPDEALIYFLSTQSSLAATYRASLISAHPPLYYFLLHGWRWLGNSELMLRLPSVLAGAGFCWLGFKWLGRIADQTAALVGLIFFCFTPALVALGAELRQYSLLLFFFAACLYLLETAIQENSAACILLFSLSLWLAILTQYSAWIFCLVVGIYALLRFARKKRATRLLATWAGGQAIGLAIYGFLYQTQVPWLLKMAKVDKVFQGEQSRLASIPRETFRLFHYLFSQPVVGAVALLLFLVGVIGVWVEPPATGDAGPSGRQLACLLFLPLLVSWIAALAHLYPYDGTRHSIVLAVFVIAAVSLGLTWFGNPVSWKKPVLTAGLLVLCYLLPAPLGPYMKPRNQNRRLLAETAHYVRQAVPQGAVFLLDDQTTYVFRYYFCRDQIAPFTEIPGQFRDYPCGGYRIAGSRQWMFTPDQLSFELKRAGRIYGLRPGAAVWLLQAGWNVNKEPGLRAKLPAFGCSAPRSFGDNILLCRLHFDPLQAR